MREQVRAATVGGIAGFLTASVGLYWGVLPLYTSGTVTLAACAVILVCVYAAFTKRER